MYLLTNLDRKQVLRQVYRSSDKSSGIQGLKDDLGAHFV